MYLYFFFWLLRAIIYKPFFGKMGSLSYIGKPIFIRGFKRIFIGKRVHILPSLRIEVVNSKSRIEIQDDVSIAQNVHITSGGNLIIEKQTTILANVCITNIDHQYSEIDVNNRRQPLVIKETRIGTNCMIGMGSIILAGTCLGKQCIVGSNSVVKGSFPDYCVIAGSPAKIIKCYNSLTKEWERV